MTFRMLTKDENFNSITGWLNEYLNNQKSFVPELNNIPNLTSKGIYFWFIHPDGYQEMSKKVNITALESRYSRMINGISYDLIYIGTAGTRNTGTGTNNGDLMERFKWHINNNIGESSVKHGSMSTLRRTLIPLFSDDLLMDEAQKQLNNYFAKYFYAFYIEYPGTLTEVSAQIGSDEIILIKNLNPLFNIKHNQNIYLPLIRRRRIEVFNSTKIRLSIQKN